jgi:hypothetical protein
MSGFETRFAAGEDAERIRSAFYGFLARHEDLIEGPAHLRTEIAGDGHALTVRLWSAEALAAFMGEIARRDAGRR